MVEKNNVSSVIQREKENKEEERILDVEPLRTSGEVQEDVDKGKNYVPVGYESVEGYLSDMREEYQADVDADRENRDEAIYDKKFAAGEQWDPMVLEQRRGLPCLTINSIPQFTAQLVGDWRTNKTGIKVVPSEDGDKEIASIRGDLIRSIEMKSRATRVYDSAFESMVQCGDGALRVAVEYASSDVFDQEIYIRPIDDALSVVWDRLSVDPTGRDARHCFVDDVLPKKVFERKWPGVEYDSLSNSDIVDLRSYGWMDEQTVRVTEHWRMIEKDRLLGLFEDGSILIIDDSSDYEELQEQHGTIVRTRIAPVRYAQMHLVTGFKILAGPFEWQLERLPIIRMTGRVINVNGRRIRHGIVRFMRDAARLRNFWRSVAAEQLGYAPKAQWIATESAIEGREDDLRRAHLTRDPLLVVNDEAVIGQNIQRLEPPAPQMALLNEAQVNVQDMKDVTGIHDASLGVRSNETSGRAIHARQREGDIASLTYYDNGNIAVLEAGDVINQLIPQIYDSTRVIRIIGEDEEPKLVTINDPYNPDSPNLAVGHYDVAIQTGASYTTRRVEAAQSMMEAIQVWPQLMPIAGDLVAKAQDWPGAQELAERLKKTIPPQLLSEKEREEGEGEQGGPQVTPEMMMELQAAIQQLQAENEQLKAGHDIDVRKLDIDAYNAETQRLKAIADAESKENQLQAKYDELAAKMRTELMNSPDILPNNNSGAPSPAPTQSQPSVEPLSMSPQPEINIGDGPTPSTNIEDAPIDEQPIFPL